jgi:uncharacterized phage-associated protein
MPAELDPRSVANLILSVSDRSLTNLEIQKLLYFAHGIYLTRFKQPLVSGYFEAWTHGPVHPAVYTSFKEHGGSPINSPAKRKDLRSGTWLEIELPTHPDVQRIARMTVDGFGNLTAGQLVRLSHARDGPWDKVFMRTKRDKMLGLRISNDLIFNCFKFHTLTTCKLDEVDEPDEDTPLAYHRFG